MFGGDRDAEVAERVPWDDLIAGIERFGAKVRRKPCGLIVETEVSRAELTARAPRVMSEVSAIIEISAELKKLFAVDFDGPLREAAANAFASLGALTTVSGKQKVFSRLSLYDADNERAWPNLHVPLIVSAAVMAGPSIVWPTNLLPLRGALSGVLESSEWGEVDMRYVVQGFGDRIFATASAENLTAEFPIAPGNVAALLGHEQTALFRLHADQPHPTLGGGLLAILLTCPPPVPRSL